MSNYITAESFGSDLPENWELIAEKLNRAIDELGIADDHDAVNELWNDYFDGKGINWYAVLLDREDNDWGTGSYVSEKAIEMARYYRKNNDYPDAYVVVINLTYSDEVAVEEIHDLDD